MLGRNKTQDLPNIVYGIVSKIKSLDKKYIEELQKKYDYISGSTYNYPADLTDVLYDLSVYIVNHVNKEISGETIMAAVESVYRKTKVFSEDKIEMELERTKDINKKLYEISFPNRKRIYPDEHVETEEYHNKFDFDSVEKTI